MKTSKSLLLLSFLLFFSVSVHAVSIDLSIGANIDIMPRGIEIVQPGAAIHCWLYEEWSVSPGAGLELYWFPGRFDGALNFLLKAGEGPVWGFGGLGAVLQYDSELHLYPAVELGGRLAFEGWPVLTPLISVRFKTTDADTDLRGLCGLSF